MNAQDYLFHIFPKILNYKLSRWGFIKPTRPITLTFSVTAACNSLCKTCQIGAQFRNNPERAKEDLRIDEIEKIFQSIGPVYFFNISGGEPFLRNDFDQIIDLACRYLKPKIIHTPTNALLPNKIFDMSQKSLKIIQQYNPHIAFSVKPSIDGVGGKHDEIRGVLGNFEKLTQTIDLLKSLEKTYPNFHLELGTVISKFNINDLDAIEDYVHSLGIQSYRNEIAEQRHEFFNVDDPITPSAEEYQNLMKRFKQKIRDNVKNKKKYTKTTEAFRLTYYDLVPKILDGKNIPCYAGISNAHLNYNGDLWPCCVLAQTQALGNLRETHYDFWKIWHCPKAQDVRRSIRDKKCCCPLANQAYSNILCHSCEMLKVVKNFLIP